MGARLPRLLAVAMLVASAACADGGGGSAGGSPEPPTTPTPAPAAPPTGVSSGIPPILAIVSPAAGAEVGGNVVVLDLTSSGVDLAGSADDPAAAGAHFEVFVDRDPVAPGEVAPEQDGIVHTTSDPVVIPGLSIGRHRISVTFADSAHRRTGFTEAVTDFTVTGPSLSASAPGSSPQGQPVAVGVALDGVTLDADRLLYLLVDAAPPAAGQQLPEGVGASAETTLVVSDLAPGEHTLWVVLGSADRVVHDPPVMDRVTVSVTP